MTGASGRHNKALRDISDWLANVQKFLTGYDLYGGDDLDVLLQKNGEAKLDLTSMSYNGRPLLPHAKKIKGADVTPLMEDIITAIEELRRYLINPSLQGEKMKQSALSLRSSFEKLRDALSTVERM